MWTPSTISKYTVGSLKPSVVTAAAEVVGKESTFMQKRSKLAASVTQENVLQ